MDISLIAALIIAAVAAAAAIRVANAPKPIKVRIKDQRRQ
jgi:hypothetical protein